MSIRRRGKAFQVRAPGERAHSFPTRASAEKYELHRKVARSLGHLHEEQPITVSEALDGYVQRWQARKQPAASSVKRAEDAMLFWHRQFGDRLLTRLSLVEVEDAVAERATDHPNSAKKELEWLKRTLKDERRRRQGFDPGLLLIDPISAPSRQGIALDLDQLRLLGSCFPDQIRYFPELVGSNGLRLGEALSLTADRVDLEQGVVFIPASMCKERRDKRIEQASFERRLWAKQLLTRPAGTPYVFSRAGQPGQWDKSDFYVRVWHPARETAASAWRQEHRLPAWEPTPFDTIVPHDLRHTAISLMAAAGMRPELIAVRVGHKDGGRLILERYRHLFPGELKTHLERYERMVAEA